MSDAFPKPSGDCITDRMRQNRAKAKAESELPPARGWAASLLDNLDAEIWEVEKAQISAVNAGDWPRYHRLCGQRTGLAQAKWMIKETQPNK
jgi:hypothetical protein